MKITNIFNNINNSIKAKVSVCIILTTIVITGYFIANSIIDKRNYKKHNAIDDIYFISSIENISSANDNIVLEGYAFIYGTNSINLSTNLFLQEVNNGTKIQSDIEQIERQDVDSYFLSENKYINSGFRASFNNVELKETECYEIFINIINNENDERKTLSTNKYLFNGQLYNYNPNDFDQPEADIKSELLHKVFTDGYLCLYHKYVGIYLYQYEGKLYWIMNDSFDFDDNNRTRIYFHLYTPQINNLPAERIEYGFDNLDFYFEDYEYTIENTAPYRVAIRDIPDKYLILYAYAGIYNTHNGKFMLSENFHLDHNLK